MSHQPLALPNNCADRNVRGTDFPPPDRARVCFRGQTPNAQAGLGVGTPVRLISSPQLQGASLLTASVTFRFIPTLTGVRTCDLRPHTSGDSAPGNYSDACEMLIRKFQRAATQIFFSLTINYFFSHNLKSLNRTEVT